jgi:hypothetical protein
MDPAQLLRLRSAALTGRLPEGLSPTDLVEYSDHVVTDYHDLARAYGSKDALRRIRSELLALKRADGILTDRARALIRAAQEEELL